VEFTSSSPSPGQVINIRTHPDLLPPTSSLFTATLEERTIALPTTIPAPSTPPPSPTISWERQWYAVAFVEDLPDIPYAVRVLNKPLAIWKDKQVSNIHSPPCPPPPTTTPRESYSYN